MVVCDGSEVVMAGEMMGGEREREIKRERCQLEKWEKGVFLCQLYT
jgi:hypothetical protein